MFSGYLTGLIENIDGEGVLKEPNLKIFDRTVTGKKGQE